MYLSPAHLELKWSLDRRQASTTTTIPSTTTNPTAAATSAISTSTSPSAASPSNSKPLYVPIAIGVVAGILGIALFFFAIRLTRIKHKNPKYVPTSFLKKAWKNWQPKSSGPAHHLLPDTNEHLESVASSAAQRSARSSQPPSAFDAATRGAVERASAAAAVTDGGVDRNTSVRSVMTLPAYNMQPQHNEQVLGREGERGGIDVVIEFPETVDIEEQRREEEMEALYQVRLARRREGEEREERRRLRREARDRGDHIALRELQAVRAQPTATSQAVEALRAEHERVKKERQRAVSSVQYRDLGVARHDGTRIRANSIDSEREGLLGDAASIAASSHYHRRDRSASSILSLDTVNSELPSPRFTRSRANSRAESPLRAIDSASEVRAGSSPEIIEHEDIPSNSPPEYENIPLETPHAELNNEPPPDYSSPVLARGEHNLFEPVENNGTEHTTADSTTHIKLLNSETGVSNSSSGSVLSPPHSDLEEQRPSSSRGVGGVPQLPSLRLSTLPRLPSIHVDPGSPKAATIGETHHP